MKDAASKGWSGLTLALKASDESDTFAWKKFVNNPSLIIQYNSIPNRPTGMTTDPKAFPDMCRVGASSTFLGSATPKLSAKLTDPDNGLVHGRFEWWHTGGSLVGSAVTDNNTSGSIFSVPVPAGAFSNGQALSWRVRTEDGLASSAWSPWCEYTIDTAAPDKAPVVSSTDYPEMQWAGSLGRAGAFTFSPNGVTDVVSYVYGLEKNPPTTLVTAGAGAVASVTLTPTSWGPLHLYVQSKDHVGKLSPVRTYEFFVNEGSEPVAHWHLDEGVDGTAADASGNGYSLSLEGSSTWGEGRVAKGVHLPGTQISPLPGPAWLDTATPVVRTDQNFTVSAWVRRLQSDDCVVVSQNGVTDSGFLLEYYQGRWSFGLRQADVQNALVDRALSVTPAQIGVWTNLMGVYDALSGQVRLYVNGMFSGTATHTQKWNAGGPLQVGRRVSGIVAPICGGADIDEVRVYDRVVVDSEIPDLVNRPPLELGSWPMDEADGTVNDVSGNGNDGAVGGDVDTTPLWAEGVFGNALLLDGATCSVSTAGPVLRTDQSFTIAAWVRLGSRSDVASVVSQDGTRGSGFYLQYNQLTDRWRFAMTQVDADSPAVDGASSSDPPQLGVWTHLTGVYDAPAHELRLYVSGVFAGSAAHPSAWNANGPLRIGRAKWNGAAVNWWADAVDEVHVFAGVLSDSEIAELPSGQLPLQ